MKQLLNVLYVTAPNAYLALDGETVHVRKEDKPSGKMATVMRLPLHNLEGIVCFNYLGVSPALMGACADRCIDLSFLSPNGRFLARVVGRIKGNVLLRKKQYRISETEAESIPIAQSFLLGKISNCRKVIERACRDHAIIVDTEALHRASASLREILIQIPSCEQTAELMGFEGSAAKIYFSVFDQLILQQKEDFAFKERSRRPPLDNMNALLSFFYTDLPPRVGPFFMW